MEEGGSAPRIPAHAGSRKATSPVDERATLLYPCHFVLKRMILAAPALRQ
jgi:hypothetical protein